MPCSIRSRASVPCLMSLAAMIAFPSALCSGGAALEEAHDVGLLHDHQFFAVDLDLGARPLPKQHAVAGLDLERLHLAVIPAGPRPDGDDLAFHRLSWAVSGMRIPPADFASCSTRRSSTRSCNG